MTGYLGNAIAIEALKAVITGDRLAWVADFTAEIDTDFIAPALLVGGAIADEITGSAQADVGLVAVGVDLAVIHQHALSVDAVFVGKTVRAVITLRSADALVVDACLTERAVEIVEALRWDALEKFVAAKSVGAVKIVEALRWDALEIVAAKPVGAVGVVDALRRQAIGFFTDETLGTVGVHDALAHKDTGFLDAFVIGRTFVGELALSVEGNAYGKIAGISVGAVEIVEAFGVVTSTEPVETLHIEGTILVGDTLHGREALEVDAFLVCRTVGVVDAVDDGTLVVDTGRLSHI